MSALSFLNGFTSLAKQINSHRRKYPRKLIKKATPKYSIELSSVKPLTFKDGLANLIKTINSNNRRAKKHVVQGEGVLKKRRKYTRSRPRKST